MTDPPPSNEAGLSLIETLVAVTIVGVAFTAILGGFLSAVIGSGVHRRSATGEADIRRASEFVKAKSYVACPASSDYGSGLSLTASTATMTVRFWDGDGLADTDFTSTCPGDGDKGLQLVTISLVPPPDVPNQEQITENIDVIKRAP